MHFTRKQINELERLYKINLINSISGFKSANLIATQSKEGNTNVAVFSSVVHYGSSPPILGFVLRPTTVARNTYDNIKECKYYTINHITKDNFEDAHHTSAKYPKEISEFDKTNLKTTYKNNFLAPYVSGSPVQIGLEYLEEYHIKANDTILILGKIVDLYINKELLLDDGFVDLTKANTAVVNGLDAYAFPTELERLTYQRPKK